MWLWKLTTKVAWNEWLAVQHVSESTGYNDQTPDTQVLSCNLSNVCFSLADKIENPAMKVCSAHIVQIRRGFLVACEFTVYSRQKILFVLASSQYLVAVCRSSNVLLLLAISNSSALLVNALRTSSGTTTIMPWGIDREKWDATRTGYDTSSLWRSTWRENSSEREYEYSEALIKLQILRVSLMTALTWTSHAI